MATTKGAAPALLARNKLRSPADVAKQTLLYDDDPDVWSRWFEACGVRDWTGARRHEITDSGMLVDAAIRGQGIALARWALACDDLAGGRLAIVFPKYRALPTGSAYYLVGPREVFRRRAVTAFREWITAQTAALQT